MFSKNEVLKILFIGCVWSLIFGLTLGIITGEYLEMQFLTKQTYEVSQNGNILKNDYGYFKVEKINFNPEKIDYSNITIIDSNIKK